MRMGLRRISSAGKMGESSPRDAGGMTTAAATAADDREVQSEPTLEPVIGSTVEDDNDMAALLPDNGEGEDEQREATPAGDGDSGTA